MKNRQVKETDYNLEYIFLNLTYIIMGINAKNSVNEALDLGQQVKEFAKDIANNFELINNEVTKNFFLRIYGVDKLEGTQEKLNQKQTIDKITETFKDLDSQLISDLFSFPLKTLGLILEEHFPTAHENIWITTPLAIDDDWKIKTLWMLGLKKQIKINWEIYSKVWTSFSKDQIQSIKNKIGDLRHSKNIKDDELWANEIIEVEAINDKWLKETLTVSRTWLEANIRTNNQAKQKKIIDNIWAVSAWNTVKLTYDEMGIATDGEPVSNGNTFLDAWFKWQKNSDWKNIYRTDINNLALNYNTKKEFIQSMILIDLNEKIRSIKEKWNTKNSIDIVPVNITTFEKRSAQEIGNFIAVINNLKTLNFTGLSDELKTAKINMIQNILNQHKPVEMVSHWNFESYSKESGWNIVEAWFSEDGQILRITNPDAVNTTKRPQTQTGEGGKNKVEEMNKEFSTNIKNWLNSYTWNKQELLSFLEIEEKNIKNLKAIPLVNFKRMFEFDIHNTKFVANSKDNSITKSRKKWNDLTYKVNIPDFLISKN